MSIAEKITRAKADLDEVYAAGKQAEYDAFWDGLQDYGNRYDYASGFNNVGWTDATFKPKYDIVVRGNGYGVFSYSRFTELKKTVDVTQATSIGAMFYTCTILKTINRLVVAESTRFDSTFGNCHALENLTIEGTIGQNGFNVQWSTKLSKASITSIIDALSTTTSGLTVTLSQTAVNNAFATSEGAADGSTSEEWLALVATRSNWTISLA